MKISSKQPLLTVVFIGFIISAALFFYFIPKGTNRSASVLSSGNSTKPPEPEVINYGLPTRLKIPRINIDAPVERVGVTSQGTMAVPKGLIDAAWFNASSHPGNSGNAVVAGHKGWKNRKPGVFNELYRLQKGDRVYVEDEKGEIITFVVRELRTYGDNEDSSSVFNSNDVGSHLNLITCEGDWDETSKSYSNRLVIFADKE